MKYLAALFCFMTTFGLALASDNHVSGRVLDESSQAPIAGALVKLSGTSGNFETTTDADGRFSLSGSTQTLTREFELTSHLLSHGMLSIKVISPNVTLDASVYNVRGERISQQVQHFSVPGLHHMPLQLKGLGSFVGFVRLRSTKESRLLKVFPKGTSLSTVELKSSSASTLLSQKTSGLDTLEIIQMGFVARVVVAHQSNGSLADIMLARQKITKPYIRVPTGYMPIPYGARHSRGVY